MNKFFATWLLVITMAVGSSLFADVSGRRDGRNCSNSCSDKCETKCSDKCDRNSECGTGCLDDKCRSHSAFIPRGLTLNQTLELGLGNWAWYHQTEPCDRPCFQFQASYFHLASRKSNDLARYFLPHEASSFVATETGATAVNSLELGLISAPGTVFSERFTICPKRTVNGGYFNFYFDFSNWHRWLCGTWAEIAFAAAHVEHRLNPTSVNTDGDNTGTITGLTTVTDALNNPDWTAGRFFRGCRSKTGVDDVMIKIGWNYTFCDYDHAGLYLVGVAPTGHGTRALDVFEPLVGSNHGRIGLGLNTDWTAYECENHRLNWMVDLRYLYGLKNCERRSFDLCANGDWSRYLLVVEPTATANTLPGINFFTQRVDVTPRSQVDFWTALNWQWCNWNFEFDYNLFWRTNEEICFRSFRRCSTDVDVNTLGVGIFDINGLCSGAPVSASTMNISQTLAAAATTGNVAPSDATFVTTTRADFNRKSAEAPTALSSTISAAVAYNTEVWCKPLMLGFGGLYEFAHKKSTLEQWGVYLKGAVSY